MTKSQIINNQVEVDLMDALKDAEAGLIKDFGEALRVGYNIGKKKGKADLLAEQEKEMEELEAENRKLEELAEENG